MDHRAHASSDSTFFPIACYLAGVALQIIPIIRALTPLIGASSAVVSSIAQRRRPGEKLATEDRLREMETDLAASSRVLAPLAEHVQSLAQALEVQTRKVDRCQRQLKGLLVLSVIALAAAAAALIAALAG